MVGLKVEWEQNIISEALLTARVLSSLKFILMTAHQLQKTKISPVMFLHTEYIITVEKKKHISYLKKYILQLKFKFRLNPSNVFNVYPLNMINTHIQTNKIPKHN